MTLAEIDAKRKALREAQADLARAARPARVTQTDDERALVHLRRAVIAYGRERSKWDAGREEPHDETVYMQLHADGAGSLWVEPSGAPAFRVIVWHDLHPCKCRECRGRSAAEVVEDLTADLIALVSS